MVPNMAIGSLKNSIEILIFLLELTNTNVGYVVNIDFLFKTKFSFLNQRLGKILDFLV
jgi:hypothetical protein